MANDWRHFVNRPRLALVLVDLLGVIAILGCASTPQSTRLTAGDFEVTVNEMARSLAASEFLAGRNADSPQIRIVTEKVTNLTSDVISSAEQWMLIARVQSSLPIRTMADQKNIAFQIPPDEIAMLRQRGFEVPLTPENLPTHLMTATFRSSTRARREPEAGFVDLRKDYYLLQYEIFEIQSKNLEWNGQFEFAREAFGLAID